LRNPLAPVSTAAQLLRLSGDQSATVARASEIIGRQVGHLTRLVDDLLDVSRVTRGLVELDREPVDMRSVVAAAVEQARPLVQSRGHELRMALEAGQFTVEGDFHRLVQVVSNLLNNAAKYTPQGGVIDVRLGVDRGGANDVGGDGAGGGPADETGGNVVVQVSDNGVGIAADLLPRVFDLFTQAERTPDRAQGGLGIGLALVRSMVQLHHGEIQAASAGLNQGSTFTIRLPRIPANASVDGPVVNTPSATSRRRILIVDDNADAAATMAEMLQLLGHQVATAHDVHAALALAANGAAWDTFILDIGLPEMTGYELGRRIRKLPGLESAMLIALTGYGQARDRAIAKDAGFDHHIVKPADLTRLVQILDRR
jgi:CheY-like chemotaxis protein